MLDACARAVNYADHLAPVWAALPEEMRGTFYVPQRYAPRFPDIPNLVAGEPSPVGPPVLVASYADLKLARPRRSILLEHGAGQHYGDGNPSNPGGSDRDDALLFLCTNERVAKLNRTAYPSIPSVVIGCPKLDRWSSRDFQPSQEPTVAISFHWDNPQHPCARWAYPHFRHVIPEIARRFRVIGHGHPRWERHFAKLWGKLGIEHVKDLDEVIERADCLVIDNSSAGYEFAAVKGPTVWLNSPTYPRDIDLPPRFWSCVPGPQVDEPEDLIPTIEEALLDTPVMRENRRRALACVYDGLLDGGASSRAAEAIGELVGGLRDATVP